MILSPAPPKFKKPFRVSPSVNAYPKHHFITLFLAGAPWCRNAAFMVHLLIVDYRVIVNHRV